MKRILLHRLGKRNAAFSLIELMVATALLTMMLVMVFQMLKGMQSQWKRTRQAVGEFKDARAGFDELTRRIGGATLNTYWGYRYGTATVKGVSIRVGQSFIPQSELHFVCGPVDELGLKSGDTDQVGGRYTHAIFYQAPFGFTIEKSPTDKSELKYERMNSTLNSWGYYIEFNTDELDRPEFLVTVENAPLPRPRYRLMEFRQPTEYLQVYKLNLKEKEKADKSDLYRWFTEGNYSVNSVWNTSLKGRGSEDFFRTTRPIAENIIGMILRPREADESSSGSTSGGSGGGGGTATDKTPLAPNFIFDSRAFQWSGTAESLETKHQLPPIIDVTFIAVDEPSFLQYCAKNSIRTAGEDPKLVDKDWFKESKNFSKDIKSLQEKLHALGLPDFRIFNTSIRMRESKWVDDTVQAKP